MAARTLLALATVTAVKFTATFAEYDLKLLLIFNREVTAARHVCVAIAYFSVNYRFATHGTN